MRYLTVFVLAIGLILSTMNLKGQEIALTLEDLIPGGKTYQRYQPTRPLNPAWYGDNLTYQKKDSIILIDESGKEKTFITLEQVNSYLELSEKLRSIVDVRLGKTKNIFVTTTNYLYGYDIEKKEDIANFKLLYSLDDLDLSEESLHLAYTKENNLYIQNAKGEEIAISDEQNKKIVYGQSVHQNEFGISKGTFWSPKGNLLAFYKMDQSMVSVYPLVNTSTRVSTLKERIYPMAGMKSHHVKIGIYNTNTQDTVFLKTGTPKEKYLTNIAWSPDESTVYVAELNRGQDTCVLNSYDPLSGKKIKTLFTETHPKYVEPENPILFVKNNDDKFIWQSKRDGFNHLYLYDIEGKLIKQITRGNFDVLSVLGFDEKGNNIFYTSTEESPLEQHIYSINLKSGKKVKLSKEEGVHRAMLSPSGKYLYDFYDSQHNPGKAVITEVKNNKSTVFYSSKNPYANVTLPEISIGKLTANDGKTDLYYRLVKPLNFDETKKYPVIIYVYGGPHSQLVSNTWQADVRGWDIYMAEKGYVVFTLDNRGTMNRGFDFENITHRQLGVVETQDQMTGVEFLKSLPYVDSERIGVHGWSFGGFMTLNMMLRHPDVFKVGVAGGPVADWKYYEIMYGERYMDMPKENPDGYKDSNMINHIGNLQGRLLLIHGDEDPVVLMQHTSQLIKEAVKEGVHPDLFIYPGHKHNVIGKDRIHLYEHITRYFEDFLK